MKAFIILLMISLTGLFSDAQNNPLFGSIREKKTMLNNAKEDTIRLQLMIDISFLFMLSHPDTCFFYAQHAFQLAHKLHHEIGMERTLAQMGAALRFSGNYPKGMECELKALQLAEKLNDTLGLVIAYAFLGAIYRDQGYAEQALANLLQARKYADLQKDPFWKMVATTELGYNYAVINQLDSGLACIKITDRINMKYNFHYPFVPYTLATIYEKRKEYDKAIFYFRMCSAYAAISNIQRDILTSSISIAKVYEKTGKLDSTIFYLNNVLADSEYLSIPIQLDAVRILSDIYEQENNKDSIVKYLKLESALKDSLFGQENARQVQNLTYNEILRQQEITDEKARTEALRKKNQQKIWLGVSVFFIVFLGLFGFYRYRMAQLLKLQSIRNEISKNLHDDIGSTLSSITVLSEIARSKMQEGQQEQSISVLSKINSYSLEMMEKMSDIVWAVNSRNDHLEDLIQRIKNASAETCSLKNIKLNIEVDENFKKLLLPIASMRNIYLICRESINNAIKHAECNLIDVIFKIHSGMIEIMIRDNGRGFDTLKENTGNGLKNIQIRAHEINGKTSIHSKPNDTMIIIQIPVSKIR